MNGKGAGIQLTPFLLTHRESGSKLQHQLILSFLPFKEIIALRCFFCYISNVI